MKERIESKSQQHYGTGCWEESDMRSVMRTSLDFVREELLSLFGHRPLDPGASIGPVTVSGAW